MDVNEPCHDVAALEVKDTTLSRRPLTDFGYSPVLDDDGAPAYLSAGGEDFSFDDDGIRYPQPPPGP
jgi:hypothetical protein